MNSNTTLKINRRWRLLFMTGLFLSWPTAVPGNAQVGLAVKSLAPGATLRAWLHTVLLAYRQAAGKHPFFFFGYNWLAFAHLVLALLFLGLYQNPVKNIWDIQFGMIACGLVIPFAFPAGHFRAFRFSGGCLTAPMVWLAAGCSAAFTPKQNPSF